MITYNSLDLFGSGPCLLQPGPLEGRDAVANSPGSVGATVVTQGTAPRKLAQRGTLVADDADALQSLIDAIQAQVSAGAFDLIDTQSKTWTDCLMQRFEPQPFHRLGPRFAAHYEITYLQINP